MKRCLTALIPVLCVLFSGCCALNNQQTLPDRGVTLSLIPLLHGGLCGAMSRVGAPEVTAFFPPMRFAGILKNSTDNDLIIFDEFCFDGWGALSIQLERKNKLIDISRIAWPGPSSISGVTTIGPGESFVLLVPLLDELWDANVKLVRDRQPGDRVRLVMQLRFKDGRPPKEIESNFIH